MVEPLTVEAPHRPRRVMLRQWWRHLCFLHWPLAPELARPHLPPGVEPDVLDGTTYVGLIAFLMDDTGPLGGPGVPYLGRFPETNVRLYSVDRHGRRGVVFLSLDASRLLPVLAGRALGLRYVWSRMSVRAGVDGQVAYACRRRPRAGLTNRITVRAGAPIAEPTALEHFVTARWALHAAWGGRTLYLPNAHPPWPLRRAELLALDDELLPATGLPRPDGPPVSVLYSAGVPVRFGWPSIIMGRRFR